MIKENLAKAFQDPTKKKILELLHKKTMTATEIVDEIGTTKGNVSQHLSFLKMSGIIETYRKGKFIQIILSDDVPDEFFLSHVTDVILDLSGGNKANDLDLKNHLYILVNGLHEFLNHKKITKEFEKTFEYFVSNYMPVKKEKKWYSLVDFIEAMEKPLKEINIFDSSKDEDIKFLKHYPILEFGKIHYEYLSFFFEYENKEDIEDKFFRPILSFCRKAHNQSLYNQIRLDLFTFSPVIEEKHMNDFLKGIKHFDKIFSSMEKNKNLSEYLLDFYDRVEGKELIICSRCKYVKKKNSDGLYECHSKNICSYYEKEEKSELLPSKKIYYVLKESFYYFITIPSLFEYRMYKTIKEKLKLEVVLFPDIERKGDLAIYFKNGKTIFVDLKDQKEPRKLFDRLLTDGKASKLNFIVVPNHHYKLSHYKTRINMLKEDYPQFNVISENEFISKVKDMNRSEK